MDGTASTARGDGAESPQARLPRVATSLVRAAAPWKRPAGATTTVPDLGAGVRGWTPDASQLAAYRRLMGSGAAVPIAFPQIALTTLHLDLLSRWSFPIRAMGLIHPGFVVEVLDDLPADRPWDLRARVAGGRHVRSGLEFDLLGEVVLGGRVVWRSRAVTLSRSAAARGSQDSAAPALDEGGAWSREVRLEVPEGTGRSFARVSGDVNPIHLHPATARLFGFRRPIAHGWWIAGRTAAALGPDDAVAGRILQIVFRRPVEIPSAPLLRSRDGGGGVEFAVVPDRGPEESSAPGTAAGGGGRPLVLGRISPGPTARS